MASSSSLDSLNQVAHSSSAVQLPEPMAAVGPPAERKVASRPVPITAGTDSQRGKRATMEDKVTVLPHPMFSAQVKVPVDNGMPRSFFAVYDGHGGEVCAEYCRRYLHGNMVIQDSFKRGDIGMAVQDAVLVTERNFMEAARKAKLENTSGTCAIIAYIEGDQLCVGNVGDSRAVLSRRGKAIPLSFDHKPNRPDERRRIEESGGSVARADSEAANPPSAFCVALSNSCLCPCLYVGPMRVYPGGLAVSRSLGDVGLKNGNLVIADPELTMHTISEEDEFVILACDGIWDVVSNQEAVSTVGAALRTNQNPTQACSLLIQRAMRQGSMDNCSVIVIVFAEESIYSRSNS